MARFNEKTRLVAANLRLAGGMKLRPIASQLHMSVRTVSRITKKYLELKTVKDLPRKARSKATSKEDDRRLIRRAVNNPFLTAPDLQRKWARDGVEGSVTTVKRRLKVAGLAARVARKVPLITESQKVKRFEWSKNLPTKNCEVLEQGHLFRRKKVPDLQHGEDLRPNQARRDPKKAHLQPTSEAWSEN